MNFWLGCSEVPNHKQNARKVEGPAAAGEAQYALTYQARKRAIVWRCAVAEVVVWGPFGALFVKRGFRFLLLRVMLQKGLFLRIPCHEKY